MRGPARLALSALCAALLLLGCSGRPPRAVAEGERIVHEAAGFSLVVPAGWAASENRSGFALLRSTPYGGGFPILNARVVEASEAAAMGFDGRASPTAAGPAFFRYERWTNPRGRGYRLEVLVDLSGRLVFVDGSVWDPALRMDREFFEQQFWPIVNSLRAERKS